MVGDLLMTPNLLIHLVAALAGAIVGALVTFLLSIWRFRAEKRWEKRLEAYEKLIEAFEQCETFWSYKADMLAGRIDGDDEVLGRLHEQEKVARGRIGLANRKGFLVLGSHVHDVLNIYAAQFVINLSQENELLQAEKTRDLFRDYLDQIIRLAQRDLKRRA